MHGWDVRWRDARKLGDNVSVLENEDGGVEVKSQKNPLGVDWLRPHVLEGFGPLGLPEDSAQVNSFLLTRKLASLAQGKGVEIVYGKVETIVTGKRPGITYTTPHGLATLEADDIIVAAGPWTTQLLPSLPITPLRSHSIVARSLRPLSANILFPIHAQENSTRDTEGVYPEMYPRPADTQRPFPTLYTCGPDDTDTLLGCPTREIPVSDLAIEELSATVIQVSTILEEGEIIASQACYKPQLRVHGEGEEVGPAIRRVGGCEGIWVAAGHDEWGVSNGPATGFVLAEMVMEGWSKTLGEAAGLLDPRLFMMGGFWG